MAAIATICIVLFYFLVMSATMSSVVSITSVMIVSAVTAVTPVISIVIPWMAFYFPISSVATVTDHLLGMITTEARISCPVFIEMAIGPRFI